MRYWQWVPPSLSGTTPPPALRCEEPNLPPWRDQSEPKTRPGRTIAAPTSAAAASISSLARPYIERQPANALIVEIAITVLIWGLRGHEEPARTFNVDAVYLI